MGNSRNAALDLVQSAAIDGRMKALRFRQRQFQSLHKFVSQHRDNFLEAAQVDDSCSRDEAQIEFASALIDLRNHYDALDLTADLEQEYSLANSKNNETRKIPIKITYIIPDTISVLFSVLSALGGAMEVGSCCVVELEDTVRKTSVLLRRMISESLDKEAFATVSSRAPPDYLSQCAVVDQAQKIKAAEITSTHRLLTSPVKQNIALIDRTADVELAAKEVVASRMAFGGRCRYAVDLVLVNEFKADAFIKAAVQALTSYQDTRKEVGSSTRSKSFKSGYEPSDSAWFEEEVKTSRARFVQRDSEAGILQILERTSSLLHRKVSSRIIVVTRFTSLDDPVDLLDESNEQPAVGAIYLFAAPREAKYLSQYISSQVTFVNHIPAQLLVGPTTPLGYPVSLRTRYSRDMFEYPSPQITTGPRSHLTSKVLSGSTQSAWLVSVAQKPLKPTGQKPAGAYGFFEQGMVIGALVYLLPIVSISLFSAGYAGVFGY